MAVILLYAGFTSENQGFECMVLRCRDCGQNRQWAPPASFAFFSGTAVLRSPEYPTDSPPGNGVSTRSAGTGGKHRKRADRYLHKELVSVLFLLVPMEFQIPGCFAIHRKKLVPAPYH